jgi:hypothetical protein
MPKAGHEEKEADEGADYLHDGEDLCNLAQIRNIIAAQHHHPSCSHCPAMVGIKSLRVWSFSASPSRTGKNNHTQPPPQISLQNRQVHASASFAHLAVAEALKEEKKERERGLLTPAVIPPG